MLRLGAGQVSLMGPGVAPTVFQRSSRSPEGWVGVGRRVYSLPSQASNEQACCCIRGKIGSQQLRHSSRDSGLALSAEVLPARLVLRGSPCLVLGMQCQGAPACHGRDTDAQATQT
jgi:hypothetical protein